MKKQSGKESTPDTWVGGQKNEFGEMGMKKYFNVKVMGLGIVIVYALYLVLTGLVAPFAGRRIAQNSLTDALKRNTQIESISFNPFTLEARVKNFVIESNVPPRKPGIYSTDICQFVGCLFCFAWLL